MPLAARIVVSVLLLGVVAYHVDWATTYEALARCRWTFLVLAFVAFNGSMVLAARRWQVLLNGTTKARTSFAAATRATYSSLWLSNFLPTAFGGDIARVSVARRCEVDLGRILAVCFLDRYLGLATLSILFVGCEFLISPLHSDRALGRASLQLAFAFLGSLVVLYLAAHWRVARQLLRQRWFRFLARCAAVMRRLAGAKDLRMRVVALNIVACCSGLAAYWAAANCFSTDVTLTSAVAAAVLGTVASALPISLSGWGVREGTVAAVLVHTTGMPASEAGLIALVNGAVIGATAFLGLAAWLDRGAIRPGAAAQS